MHPVMFPEANNTLSAPNCIDLPVYADQSGFISCWELTQEERETVLKTGKIWLLIASRGHPPVLIQTGVPEALEKSQWPEEIEAK
jgi:hypothetical protein